MLEFLSANLATILVASGLTLLVVAIVVKMVRDRKKGGSSCGSCAGCPNAGICHPSQKTD